jgi:hypothetical protein
MTAMGGKLGMDPWISQLACYGSGREPFFSGAVALSNDIFDYEEGSHMRTV